jgi:hypothetical protein
MRRVQVRWRSAAIPLLGALLSSSGCSFFFIKGLPPDHQQQIEGVIDCTEAPGLPLADTALTGALALGVLVVASKSQREWDRVGNGCESGDGAGLPCVPLPPRNLTLAISVSAVLIAGASMVYGYAKTKTCRRANRDLLVRKPWRPAQEATQVQDARAPADRAPCVEARRVKMLEAQAIADAAERIRRLEALPDCGPVPAGTAPLIPPPLAPPAPRPPPTVIPVPP